MALLARSTSLSRPPAFCDPVAVEAWDAWFRWHEGAGLRDADIAATWQRVSIALARVERGAEARWAREFANALQGWHALPDARVLAAAGTGRTPWPGDELAAAVNVAAFVRDAFTPQARLDLVALEHAAGVSVRMLDNAILLAGDSSERAPRLRVGLIGMADALLMLGRTYDSAAARADGRRVAVSLALGCAHESMRLAAERGTRVDARDLLSVAAGRDTIDALAGEIERNGLRHAQLTAIGSQRRLALLANNVADALDPLRRELQIHRIDSLDAPRLLRSSGSTLPQLARRPWTPATAALKIDTIANVTVAAQQAMRAALQPWIDVPIDYPLVSAQTIAQTG